MTRRACETCRFVKVAGFDNMGWCTHPKLQLGSDAKIFVRLNTINCRNGWASDLWQPADVRDAETSGPALAQVEAPATIDELDAVFGVRTEPKPVENPLDVAARGEDVVVGETTVLAGGVTKAFRANLKRAHEELKARKREPRFSFVAQAEAEPRDAASPPRAEEAETMSQRDAGRGGDPEDLTSFVSAAIESTPVARKPLPPRPISGEVSPVALGELGRPFPKMTTFPDDDARFSTIPEPVEGIDLPLRGKERKTKVVGRAGFDSDDFDFPTWGAEADAPASAETEQPAAPAPQPAPRRQLPERPRRPDERVIAGEPRRPQPAAEVTAERAEDASEPVFPALPDFFVGQHEVPLPAPQPRERTGRVKHEPEAPARIEAEAHPIEEPVRRRGPRFVEPEPDLDLIEIDAGADDAVEPRWADVPRMCRTCRDFRPAENGERGWCTNKWAFSHRRMVDADELPCETTIGGWWLPNDELWLSTLDVSAHSQPTPLLDAWISQRIAASRGYDIEAPVRRRKRS